MYISFFNIYIELNSTSSLIFNTHSTKLIEVPKITADFLQNYQKNNKSLEPKHYLEFDIDLLWKMGFIVTIPIDQELQSIRKSTIELRKKSYSSRNKIALVFSYDCNLECPFCYQRSVEYKKNKMTLEQLQSILNSTIPNLPLTNNDMIIELFGGEPLLEDNRLLITEVLNYIKKNKIKLSILTNGVNLNIFISLFNEYIDYIEYISIAIDIKNNIYSKKNMIGLENIIKSVDKLAKKIVFRFTFNISVGGLKELLAYHKVFEKFDIWRHDNIIFSWRLIENPPLSQSSKIYNSSPLDYLVYQKKLSQLDCTLASKLTEEDALREEFKRHNISHRSIYCAMSMEGIFTIDAKNDIYVCTKEVGFTDKRIGYIDKGKIKFNQRYSQCRNRTPDNIDLCQTCPLVFICGGGCAAVHESKTGSLYKVKCNQEEEIEFYSQKIIQYYNEGILEDYLVKLV